MPVNVLQKATEMVRRDFQFLNPHSLLPVTFSSSTHVGVVPRVICCIAVPDIKVRLTGL